MEASNVKAMREALKEIRARLAYLYGQTYGTFNQTALKEVYEIADSALSAPPRNLDKYRTSKEAYAQFVKFCEKQLCSECKFSDEATDENCAIAWLYFRGVEMMDYSNVRAVCYNCARKAGFVQKKKAVIVFEDECGICKARRPCTDLWHDWIPPKEESEASK